jgi:dihydrofolate synthase/folylpolyglutamate synthase
MLDDKDIAGFLAPFATLKTSMTAMPLDDEPRAMPVREIVAAAENAGLAANVARSVADALSQITQGPRPVRVLVTGSHLLVGATLRANNSTSLGPRAGPAVL